MFDCLKNIVGILDADCECFTDALEASIKEELLNPQEGILLIKTGNKFLTLWMLQMLSPKHK